jgi:hypothetical protein
VPLPGTSYPSTLTYIIPKTSHYRRLINWRWVQHINLGICLLSLCYPVDQYVYIKAYPTLWTSEYFNSIKERQVLTKFNM